MKKHIVNLIVIACVLSSSISASCASSNTTFDGWYWGLNAGGTQGLMHLESNTSASYMTTYGTNTTTNRTNANIYNTRGIGAVNLGYGKRLSNVFYLSGELSLSLANSEISNSDNETTTDPFDDIYAVTLNNSTKTNLNKLEFSADLKPGVLINKNTLFFARIGTAFNNLRMNSNATFTFDSVPPGALTTATIPISINKKLMGLRLGFGLETQLKKQLTLKIDYIYTNYGKITGSGVTTITTVNGGPTPMTSTNTVKVHRQVLMLGLNYYLS